MKDFFKGFLALCLACCVFCIPLGYGGTSVSAYTVSDRTFTSQSDGFSNCVPGLYSESTVNGFLSRCYSSSPDTASDYFLELYSTGGSYPGGIVYFFDSSDYTAAYDSEHKCYVISGLGIHNMHYSWSWSGTCGISNNVSVVLAYYPDNDYFTPLSSTDGVSFVSSGYTYYWRSNIDFSLSALDGVGSFSAALTSSTDDTFTVTYSNNLDTSVQYVTWVSPLSCQTGSGVSNSYQGYTWCYQTVQNCLLYRQRYTSSFLEGLADGIDIWGQAFAPINCVKIPLCNLLRSVADTDSIGCYSQEYMACPYQYLSAGSSKSVTYRYSDMRFSDGDFLTVAYRPTCVSEVPAHHRASYSYVYFDSIESLDTDYSVALCASISCPDDYVYSPSLTDENGNSLTDSDGNSIFYGTNYSDDIYSIRSTVSGTVQGGSASVVNNNNPIFNNNISIGGSGSGSSSDSDSSGDSDGSSGSGGFSGFGDLKGFKNALDGSKNFLSIIGEYDNVMPSSCSILLGAGVVAIIICRFIGR